MLSICDEVAPTITGGIVDEVAPTIADGIADEVTRTIVGGAVEPVSQSVATGSIQLDVKLNTGPCAGGKDGKCVSAQIEKVMDKYTAGAEKTPIQIVNDPNFVKFAETQGVTPAVIEKEKQIAFKPVGPRNTTSWLNDSQIDKTMQQWAREFPKFYNYEFAMMDFAETGSPFSTTDVGDVIAGRAPQVLSGDVVVKRPATMLGCVLNTDVSTGHGKHWVACFVDLRDKKNATVEYFNSAGRPPPMPMIMWMEKTKQRLEALGYHAEVVAVTSVAHQDGKTECGLYSLYYIRRRLEGTPYSFFEGDRVPDEAMTEFRKYVFRP